jgi:6-phosphogluconolactonase (cycloisomerase 2 family)
MGLVLGLSFISASCGGGSSDSGSGGGGGNNPPAGGSTANQFAYVIQSAANQINAFQSDANGNLTPVGTVLATGIFPHHVDVDAKGRFVYVSNHESAFLSGYRINQDGTLSQINPIAGSPVTGLGNPPDPAEAQSHSSVIDPSGQFIYVIAGPESGGTATLKAYSIETSQGNEGKLTALVGQSFPVGVHAHNIAMSPNGQFVYVASEGSGQVYGFSRDTATGLLTSSGPPVGGLNSPMAVTVDPQSRFVYATQLNSVEVFQIGSGGALTRIPGTSSFPTGNAPHALTVHPNGQFLYTANVNGSTISAFRVDSSTGALTPIQTEPTGGQPNYIIVHPNWKTLYTADADQNTGNKVSRFTINGDGTLSPAGDAATFPPNSGTNGIGTTKF